MSRLHPDFPETLIGVKHSWNQPNPLADICSAFEAQRDVTERFEFEQVASVELYSIHSNEGEWTPEHDDIGTELSLVLLGRLVDGRWFGLEAGNDYTGWGCQDGCDVFASADRDDVVWNGLTVEGRTALGLPDERN